MDRTVMWMQWNNLGMEQLHLFNNKEGALADSVVIGIRDGEPFRIHYEIQTDKDWAVRQLSVELLGAGGKSLKLWSDGAGRWRDENGAIEALNGCLDVDISATPFTNTLAIRRLALQPGESRQLTVLYIAIPEMKFIPVQQCYTCLEINAHGGLYKYEGIFRDFVAELLVDRDSLVIEYPNTFRRVWSTEEPR